MTDDAGYYKFLIEEFQRNLKRLKENPPASNEEIDKSIDHVINYRAEHGNPHDKKL
tara:strand:- start:1360 stop:1527 length:168 start_codon:yes stop_codon:yes gene_type:complete